MAHTVLFRGAISVYSFRHFQHTRHRDHKVLILLIICHLLVHAGLFEIDEAEGSFSDRARTPNLISTRNNHPLIIIQSRSFFVNFVPLW